MKKAFTLVELLFVTAMIALMAGFSISYMPDSRKSDLKMDTQNQVRHIFNEGGEIKNNVSEASFAEGWNTNGEFLSSNTEGGKAYRIYMDGQSFDVPLPSSDSKIILTSGYYLGKFCYGVRMKNSSITSPFVSYGADSCRTFSAPMPLDW